MIYADKGNRVKQISENEIETYVSQGYRILDGSGRLIRDAVPTELNPLKLAYSEHTKQIAKLVEENNLLRKELAETKDALLKAQTELQAKAEAKVQTVSEIAPKKNGRKKAEIPAEQA